MITKAYIERGIGDALNARDFLITYCKQKNLKQDEITVYTRLHKNIFKDTDFKIKDISDINYKSLTYYAIIGFITSSVISLFISLGAYKFDIGSIVAGIILFIIGSIIGYKLGDS